MTDNKNKILVVGSLHSQAGEGLNLANYGEYFQKAASGSYKVLHAMIDDLVFDISPEKFSIFDTVNKHELSDYKVLILRGKLHDELDTAITLSEYAHLNGLVYFNDYRQTRSISKLAQAVNFFLLGLPFPRTILTSPEQLKHLLNEKKLQYPFIYKSRFGAHGINNHLIKNQNDLSKVEKWGMIAQPFIPNDGDYRLVIFGNNHLVIKRIAQEGTHLNNTSKGGKAELIRNFDQKIISESHKLADKLKMVVAGVDVMFDKNSGKHYFLEINSQPQLMSGAFLAEKEELIKNYFKTLDTKLN